MSRKIKKKLSKEQKSLLIGLLIGDGTISSNFVFKLSHSVEQREYLEWKVKLLDKFQIKNNLYKSKSVYISINPGEVGEELAGTYEQKEILINNKYTPISVTTPDGKVYYNIETVTQLAGYKYNNGAYGEEVDETKDKCYIDNGGEYVTYLLG